MVDFRKTMNYFQLQQVMGPEINSHMWPYMNIFLQEIDGPRNLNKIIYMNIFFYSILES